MSYSKSHASHYKRYEKNSNRAAKPGLVPCAVCQTEVQQRKDHGLDPHDRPDGSMCPAGSLPTDARALAAIGAIP